MYENVKANKNILVLGAGGHALSILDCILSLKKYDKIAFLTDEDITHFNGYDVLGKIADAEKFLQDFKNAIIAIGNNEFRLLQTERLSLIGFNLPVLCHASAYISPLCAIGKGSVILAQSVVNAGVLLGTACIVNTGAIIDHECNIKDGVHISPNAVLAGGVSVGEKSWICAGAVISDHLNIGAKTIIGAGSVVLKNIPNNCTAYGVPARVVNKEA